MAHRTSVALLACCAAFAFAAPRDGVAPRLIWEDNFDRLDQGTWHHMVTAWRGGNDEFQYYRNNRKNSYVEDGYLKIRPTPVNEEYSDDDIRYGTIEEPGCNYEPCASTGGRGEIALPVFSARLYTQGSFSVRYGRIEFRAKMPRGDWLWPALWMMPENEDFYGPYPSDGEIDVLETRGNRQYREWEGGPSVGVDWASSTMHWGPDEEHNGFAQTEWQWFGSDLSDDFHSYELEWTDTHATFRIDGEEIGSVYPPEGGFWEMGGFDGDNIWADGGRMAPFDRPFYLIINVAVGGRFFPDDAWSPNGRPWDWDSGHPLLQFYENQDTWLRTWDRPELIVDYVRVYEL